VIERLQIGNLKSFRGVEEVPLAPITLIYGPNSAGKSSLIQALALLKQTISASTFSPRERPPLVLRGEYVDLGGFLTAIHGHDPENALTVAMQFLDPRAGADRGPLAGTAIRAGLEFGLSDDDDGSGGAVLQLSALLGDDAAQVSFRRRSEDDAFELADEQAQSALLALLASRISNVAVDEDRRRLGNVSDAIRAEFERGRGLDFMSSGFFPAAPKPGYLEGNRTLDMAFAIWFEEYLYARARAVTQVLEGLAYLGPLRRAPTRFQSLSSEYSQNVGISGEHTTRLLADQPQLIRDVNEWLERLHISYELSVRPVVARPSDEPVPERSEERMEIGDLVATSLVQKPGRLVVTPQDVGFGVSQLLPVVVQLLVNKEATVCIEQPEVHIHPRLQAEVSDLLIDAALKRRNQVIVETHSENLVLRIQRRIAEGELGITNEDVSVLYIDSKDGVAVPTRLELDEAGNFTTPWPSGFFTERFDEVFSAAEHISEARPRRRRGRRGADDG
jgi:predicted ATPase